MNKAVKFSLNAVVLEWDEDSRRRPLPCKKCDSPTKGRASLDSTGGSFANVPFCMTCAMQRAFSDSDKAVTA